ncbi:MAG: DUF255 domain-containing protein, partial [Desulfobacterales bacterium]
MKGQPNRLIHEKSPYLLQHAYNPVDWFPWGEEAVSRAVEEDKPIILSIGYSTCHWCHVMERESFENAEIADMMNRHFVCIKVDREERPDLDQIYMTAVAAMNASGGWPLNVFLTPDLKPFFGGTYFPAEAGRGMISWPDLLMRVARVWKDPVERKKLDASGEDIGNKIKAYLSAGHEGAAGAAKPDWGLLHRAFSYFKQRFDSVNKGFSPAPKFPSPVIQNFLLAYAGMPDNRNEHDTDRQAALDMAASTLTAMSKGGIYDHLGGGFHRYSTDEKWHVPHFEKMLYDNAQLIENCMDAFRLTGKERFKQIAEHTADYVL